MDGGEAREPRPQQKSLSADDSFRRSITYLRGLATGRSPKLGSAHTPVGSAHCAQRLGAVKKRTSRGEMGARCVGRGWERAGGVDGMIRYFVYVYEILSDVH